MTLVDRRTRRPTSQAWRTIAWMLGVSAAVVAAAVGASGFAEGAWAFLGLAVAAFGAAGWISFRALFRSLESMRRSPGIIDHGQLRDAVADSVDSQTKDLSRRLTSVEKQVRNLPYVSAELGRRYAQLIQNDLPMPVIGANWAVTAPTVLFIIDEILGGERRRHILECGSGASTVWAAAALRQRAEGHVVALEHDRDFAEQTRRSLRTHELEDWATVIDAPLVEQDIPGLGKRLWYDLSALGESDRFDLLFVDGPPGSTGRLARYPALPRLLPWLSSGATIVADDTDRAAEKRMVNMWCQQGVFDRSVSFVKIVGRSTVLVVDA